MREKKERYKLHKIEVDDNTLEPKIVEVSPEAEIAKAKAAKEAEVAETAQTEDFANSENISADFPSGAANAKPTKNAKAEKAAKSKAGGKKDALSSTDFNGTEAKTSAAPADPFRKISSDEDAHEQGKQLVMTKVFGINDDKQVDRRQKIFKNIFTVVFIVLVVGVLAFTFYKDFFTGGNDQADFAALGGIFAQCWGYLLLALLSLFLCFFCKGLKLSVLCKETTKKWHFKTCMETAVIGLYYNYVTPLAVGGQPFEIYHLSKHGVHGGVASALPIATYILNQFAFVIIGVFSLIAYNTGLFSKTGQIINIDVVPFNVLAIIGLLCCMIMPVIVILFCMLPNVGTKLVTWAIKLGGKLRIVKNPEETTAKTIKNVRHNSKCLKQLASSPAAFITAFLLSFLEHLSLSSIAYFTLRFFGFDAPEVSGFIEWAQVVLLCSILYAAISFIPTPGNSGAADLSFYVLFSTGILVKGGGFSAMLVWRILSFYSFIIIGFIFTTVKRKSDKKKAALVKEFDD